MDIHNLDCFEYFKKVADNSINLFVSFDLFVEKAKESSPLMQNDIENPEL